jgi:hypothetical protein
MTRMDLPMIESERFSEPVAAPSGGPSTGSQWLRIVFAGVALLFLTGGIAGFLAAHANDGGGALAMKGVIVLTVMLALALAMVWMIVRSARALRASLEPLAKSTRQGRVILYCTLGLGMLVGILFAVTGTAQGGVAAFLNNGPIDRWLALTLAVVMGGIVPLLSWRWHRVIDEHEREAYRDGAIAGAYAYMVGAPVWWLLWRGGWLPAPDGIAIFCIFNTIFAVVWLKRTYF